MRKSSIRGTRYTIYEDGRVISPFGGEMHPWIENNTGYLLFKIRKDKKPYCLRLHRILAECFIPNPEDMPYVRHLNDNKADNRLCNLEWGYPPQNTQEGYDNGCYAFPQKNNYPILVTDKSGRELLFKSIRECSENLGLNRKNISAYLRGKKKNPYTDYDFEYFEMPND